MTRHWDIDSDDELQTVTIRGPDGVAHTFGGFAGFAGDGFEGATLIMAEGSASDAAIAFVRGYGMPAMKPFYKSCALEFCRCLDPRALEREATAEVLESWMKEKEPVGNA